MWFARRMEKSLPPPSPPNPKPYYPTARRQVAYEQHKPQTSSPANSITPAAIQQAKEQRLCFKCRENWFLGHKKVCKMSNAAQIHAMQGQPDEKPEIIYVHEYDDDDSDEADEQQADPKLLISRHALQGKKTSKNTFTLQILVGGIKALALVDTGSTTTFITPECAAKAQFEMHPTKRQKVQVANGETVWTEFICHKAPYSIQGTAFSSDFRVFKLQGYDVILGADWIFEHSPVELNLKTLTLKVQHESGQVMFLDASLPQTADIPHSLNFQRLMDNSICGALLFVRHQQSDSENEGGHIPPEIEKVLEEFQDVFKEPTDLPPSRSCDHVIALEKDAKIVNQRCYRVPHHQKNVMEKLVADLLEQKCIRPSNSPYSSPALVVQKKDFDWRICIDFRKVNAMTIRNKFPMPVIEDLLDELNGAKIFSKIDLRSGYHQIRMNEKDIDKTTFSTHQGNYEYVVMPFGLTNAPATFQQLMNTVPAKFLRKFVLVFFDDILIYSSSVTEHGEHLKLVFASLRANQLFAKRKKCTFVQTKVEYLGHIIMGDGVATNPAKITAIVNWPTPTNVIELRSFLGMAGYYRRFIESYGVICRPLFTALKKEGFC